MPTAFQQFIKKLRPSGTGQVPVKQANGSFLPTTVNDGGGSPGGASPSLIHQATVTLTDAQIKALPTTPVDLTGTPGATRVLAYQFGTAHLNASAGSYSGVGTVDPNLAMLQMRVGNLFASVYGDWSWILEEGFDGLVMMPALSESGLRTEFANLPFVLYGPNGVTEGLGNFGGGHADNTLRVSVAFMVFDLSTGLFLSTDDSGWDQDTRTFS